MTLHALGDAFDASQGTTLHGFVTGLVNDSVARAAFVQDPAAALSGAGLGGISPADLQSAFGYALESAHGGLASAPVAGDVLAQLSGALSTLGVQTGMGVVSTDLEDIASVSAVDSLADLDGIAGVAAGGQGAGLEGTIDSVAGGLNITGAGGLEGATAGISGVSDVVTGDLAGGLSAQGGGLTAGVDSLAGQVGLEGVAGLTGSAGTLGVDSIAGTVEGSLDASVENTTAQLDVNPLVGEGVVFAEAGADGTAGGVALGDETLGLDASGLVGLGHGVGGVAVHTPTGTYGVDAGGGLRSSDLLQVEATDDLGEMLDGDVIGRGVETAASSLAAGAGMATAALDNVTAGNLPGASDLTSALPTGGLPVDVPMDGASAVGAVHGVAGQVQGAVQGVAGGAAGGNLPLDALPSGVPTDLSGAQDVVGQVQGTVQGVVGDVTSQLPVDVPTDLPVDLPVANPLPAADVPAVGDVVGQVQGALDSTPVGGVVDNLTGGLQPEAGANGEASGSASSNFDLGL